jgi:hypothetical protein
MIRAGWEMLVPLILRESKTRAYAYLLFNALVRHAASHTFRVRNALLTTLNVKEYRHQVE